MDWLKDYWIWLLVAAILVAVIIWLLFIRKRDRAVNEPAASTRADAGDPGLSDANAPRAAEGGTALGAAGATGAGQAQDELDPDAPDLGSPSYDAGEETLSADAGIEPPTADANVEDARIQPAADLPESSGLGGDDELGSTDVGESSQSRPAGSHRADLDDLTGPDTDVSAAEADLAAPESDVSASEADVLAPATDANAEDAGATAGVAGPAGAGAFVAGKYAGSAEPAADGSGPAGYSIKGNEDSMLYHTDESPYYGRTRAEVWFDTEDNARAAGFTRWDEKDSTGSATEAAGFAAVPAAGAYGVGSADPLEGGASPHESFTIKGNADSMKYHTTESPYYGRTVAETWFNSEEAAKGAGFVRWDDRSGDEAAPAAFAGVPEGAFGPGSADPLEDGSAPDGSFTVKGNADSMLYHTEESPYYGRTRAEAWFNSEETARAAGFTRWDER